MSEPSDTTFHMRMNELEKRLSPMLRERRLSKDCALIVVDMQRFFVEPESHAFLSDAGYVMENVTKLVGAWRKEHRPIFFTRHAHGPGDTGALGRWWRDPLRDGNAMSEIAMDLMEEEHLVLKDRYDAFHDTDLEESLVSLDIKEIVLSGVMTDLCVETTARSAFVRDYDVSVVMDACCTQSAELQYASLLTLAHGFAVIKRTETIIQEMM